MFWHGGFPLFVIAYAWLKDGAHAVPAAAVKGVGAPVATGMAGVAAVTLFFAGIATAGQRLRRRRRAERQCGDGAPDHHRVTAQQLTPHMRRRLNGHIHDIVDKVGLNGSRFLGEVRRALATHKVETASA